MMKKCIMLFACSVVLSIVFFANAANGLRETALFTKDALDPESPIGFWIGDAEHPPTFSFYMQHQQWYAANATMQGEAAKLLGCVAPMFGVRSGLGAVQGLAENGSPYRYRVLVLPPPPGGAVTAAAENRVTQGECRLSLEEQKLLVDVFFSAEKRQTL
jgi:hypothetical protein